MAGEHPLFLGIPDAVIDEQIDWLCSWETNKFGGCPNWMHCPDVFPSCAKCNKSLLLVAQLYCPLDHSQYHRTLYLFGCVNPSCWNDSKSWLVLRSQVLPKIEKQQETQDKEASEKFGSVDDWCDDAEDWGDDEERFEPAMEDLESQTSKLTLNPYNDNAEKQPQVISKIPIPPQYTSPCFIPYYINVFEDETSHKQSSKIHLTAHEKNLIQEYQQKEGKELKDIISTSTSTKGQSSESYERTNVSHGDYGFHKFLKCVQSCPQQCIRYHWKGMPLLMSNTNPLDVMSAVPPCQYCGEDRVYEVQLMPALVPLLKSREHNLKSPSNLTKEVNRNALFGSNDTSSPCLGKNCGSSLVDKSNDGSDNTRSTPNMDSTDQFSLAADNNRGTKDTDTQSSLVHKEKEDHIWEKDSTNGQGTVISESPSERLIDVTQFKHNVYNSEKARIEFGTVIVFSCNQSCWESEGNSLRQEFVMVQADPDEDLFNKKLGGY